MSNQPEAYQSIIVKDINNMSEAELVENIEQVRKAYIANTEARHNRILELKKEIQNINAQCQADKINSDRYISTFEKALLKMIIKKKEQQYNIASLEDVSRKVAVFLVSSMMEVERVTAKTATSASELVLNTLKSRLENSIKKEFNGLFSDELFIIYILEHPDINVLKFKVPEKYYEHYKRIVNYLQNTIEQEGKNENN